MGTKKASLTRSFTFYPHGLTSSLPKELASKVNKRLEPFDIQLTKYRFVISKKNLHFFQLAAFFQQGKKSWIQIHPKALSSSFLRKLYPLDEIVAHEFIHAFRKDLNDQSFFEEWIAYRSSSHYRKYMGPHLKNLFVFTLFLQGATICHFFFAANFFYSVLLLPLLQIVGRERTLYRAKKQFGAKYLSLFCRLTYSQIKNLLHRRAKKGAAQAKNRFN